VNERIITIEAENLLEARQLARADIPPGFAIASEEVESPGKVTRLRSTSRTTDKALEQARQAVPEDGTIVSEEIIAEAELRTLTLEAKSEVLARKQLEAGLQTGQVLESLEVKTPPRRLMGVVREPGQYEAKLLQTAVVELTYQTRTRFRFGIGPKRRYELEHHWGAFGADDDKILYPSALALGPDDTLYLGDNGLRVTENRGDPSRVSRVRKFDADGNCLMTYGSHGEGEGQFLAVQGVAADSEGYVYAADGRRALVLRFAPDGTFVSAFGSQGDDEGQFSGRSLYLASGPGDLLYVSDQGHHRILVFDREGRFLLSFGCRGRDEGQLDRPERMALDALGNVYVADGGNNRMQKFDGEGNFLMAWGRRGEEKGEFKVPRAVAVDAAGFIYVCGADCRVQKFDSQAQFISTWGKEGRALGEFDRPEDLVVDRLGRVHVLEYNRSRVQRFA